MDGNVEWWKTAVFYQIYPRSFADGNGDGMGDFYGMVDRLDVLQNLGVDAIWLSPHYPSPFVDCGYDISDYEDAAPEYGGMPQFTRFLDEVHKRGMKLILDLVLNHTSDQHPWFLESKSSLDNPKRNWFIWRKGKGNQPPNNWYSTFGSSAWTLDPATHEYYYHFFYKEQPDLNWENPDVKKAMFDMVRFWLEMGVDGFRLDAVGTIYEAAGMPDHLSKYTLEEMYRRDRLARSSEEHKKILDDYYEMFHLQWDQPIVHDLMKELRSLVDEYPDRMMVGESDDIAFYGNGKDELHLNFNFPLMRTARFTPQHVRSNQEERLPKLPEGAWPCNTLGNHDSPRMRSQFGDGIHDEAISRVTRMMLLTLKGTPFLYNREEFGMSDVHIEALQDFVDPIGITCYRMEKTIMGSDDVTALEIAAKRSRDKGRNPLQWSSEPNGGFCPAEVKPWLPMNPDYADGVNYADEVVKEDSTWNYYRDLIAWRKASTALLLGDQRFIETGDEDLLGYIRSLEGESCLVLLNMGEKAATYDTGDLLCGKGASHFSTEPDAARWNSGKLTISAHAGMIFKISA